MKKEIANKSKVLRYILDKGETSKAQIAKDMNLSMPTVLQAIKSLEEQKIICEAGVYESTGGRKAKAISVCGKFAYSVGIDITKNHIALAVLDMKEQVVYSTRKRKKFEYSMDYCNDIANEIRNILMQEQINPQKVLGVGVSIPGIINYEDSILIKSHALQLENISLKNLENAIGYPVYFENDANAALMAEKEIANDKVLYLSLSNTVGGAVCLDGQLFRGRSSRAGEFGHMTLYPDGRKCYCGKKGCVDAYCSALLLRTREDMTLHQFMEQVKKKDEECCRIWDKYLDDLALVIMNLQMVMDVDIIIGGYVGKYLKEYMIEFGEKVERENIFGGDVNYLHNCTFQDEVSAVGVARYFIDKYIEEF